MKSKVIVLSLFALLLVAPAASAQTHRASIRGTVVDPTGAVIPGANVTVISEATNETRTATSAEDGEYAITSLPPGRYRVEVAGAPGFAKFERLLVLQVNQELRLDAALDVRTEGHEVTVEDFVALKKDSPALGTVIEERQIAELPLDGRNFLELALLAPGTAPSAPGSAGSVRGDFAFSAN
ncbi:MAG: hypothetical protein QOD28_3191, partial [Acidobacteriota bacterium]|nr:hypothetical protein [Acidobacteriota bacterium]